MSFCSAAADEPPASQIFQFEGGLRSKTHQQIMHPLLRAARGVFAALLMLQGAEQRSIIDLQTIAGPAAMNNEARAVFVQDPRSAR